jgi:hypothetical protein
VTTGFVEFGATGNYLFHYTGWPDGHRGAAVFQVTPGGAIKTSVAINPEEAEYVGTRLPAALVSGRMDSSVGAMAAGTVTAAAVATDAIDADALAANAVTEIAAGLLATALVELGVAKPSATPTVAEALMLFFMSIRNKRTVDTAAGKDTIFNDAGTAIFHLPVTDAAGVFTSDEAVSGA